MTTREHGTEPATQPAGHRFPPVPDAAVEAAMKHFHPGLRPVVVAALEAARHHIEHPAYEAGFDLHRQFYSPEQLMEAKAQAWEQGFERALEWHAWDGAPDDYKPSFANPYRVTH